MFNDEVTLLKDVYIRNELQQSELKETIKTTILCQVKSVKSFEFYQAKQANHKPSIIFVIKPYEYDEQTKLSFNDNILSIIRTYKVDNERLELVCEKKIGNG